MIGNGFVGGLRLLGQRMRHAVVRVQGRALLPPGIRVGKRVDIGRTVRFDWSHGRHITIGDDATIVEGAVILCHDASSYRTQGLTRVAPVSIGRRAFIGANALILPGVHLGDDAVVAAGSVVTKSVPAGVVVAGVPAWPIGTSVALDSKRLAKARASRVFDETVYNTHPLPEARATELDNAIVTHGEYFLASPAVARRMSHSGFTGSKSTS
jgi:maltose O-acetyltransferase